MAFNLMIVLIEDIDVNEKRIKAIDIFHVDDAIIVKTDKNYSESLTLTNMWNRKDVSLTTVQTKRKSK